MAAEILFQDEYIVGLNKPPGMPVQPDKSGDPSLLEEAQSISGGTAYPLHRIDRPAGGVVLFALDPKTAGLLGNTFRDGLVRRIYWAVTDNPPPNDSGTLEHYLFTDKGKNITKAYTAEETAKRKEHQRKNRGKRSTLAYQIAGHSDRYVFIRIELLTGRHHQIRAQLKQIGCHIKGDLKYGAKRSNPGGGIHLHARSLTFPHPRTKEEITLTAPSPSPDPLWELFPLGLDFLL